MFKQISANTAVHSNGYKVIANGLRTQYIEGGHMAEFVADPWCSEKWVIFLGRVKWNPPFDGETISPERKKEIQDRVVAAHRFMNSYCDFDFENERSGCPAKE